MSDLSEIRRGHFFHEMRKQIARFMVSKAKFLIQLEIYETATKNL